MKQRMVFVLCCCLLIGTGCRNKESQRNAVQEQEAVIQEKEETGKKPIKVPETEELPKPEDEMESREERQELEDIAELPGELPKPEDVAEMPEELQKPEDMEEPEMSQEYNPVYSPQLEQNEEICTASGYYVITPTTTGGYQVMVHDGEFSYGAELLRQYLADMNCGATHIGGGYVDAQKDQYRCYVEAENIYVINNSVNDW